MLEGENSVQSACADALAIYFHDQEIEYRQISPYANQQGEKLNQFCGDLVGVMDNSALLLMEFKALNHSTKKLNQFEQKQFEAAIRLEQEGVPIIYCYDAASPLAYYKQPRSRAWPIQTLEGVNASPPSLLKSEVPEIEAHASLLKWIDGIRGEAPTSLLQAFGKVIGSIAPGSIRNEVLAVVFSKEKNQAYEMGREGIVAFNNWLLNYKAPNNPTLNEKISELRQIVEINASQKAKPSKDPTRKITKYGW